MDIPININRAQLESWLLQPKSEVTVKGRGIGKSAEMAFWYDRCIRLMPGAIIGLTCKTFGQAYTSTLPSTLKIMEKLGYQKDVNYVIGKTPPKTFRLSHEKINKFDNIISFANGTCIRIVSQSEKGSGRGANFDFDTIDEACIIDKDQHNAEIVPTNRGNLEFFGAHSKHPIPFHHGFKYTSSMPATKNGRWILEYGKYYEEEYNIRIFDIWNQIVNLQLELLEIQNVTIFKDCWNEIERLRKKIIPRLSSEGLLFSLGNSFDNIENLGLSYIRNMKNTTPRLVFLVEIMNMFINKVDDCYYAINESKQIYYNSYNNKLILENNNGSNINFDSSIYDSDCNPNLPLELVQDWGSAISLFIVCQTHETDICSEKINEQKPEYLYYINEFYVKPDEKNTIMISELCNKFIHYYKNHKNKIIYYYRDKYGDSKNPNMINSLTFNEQAIKLLKNAGWTIIEKKHKGMEPPQSDKYMLWGKILREDNTELPAIRINGNKCRYTIISMNNAKVKEIDGKWQKDKSSERKTSGVLPEEATHFSDAADKILWIKYGEKIIKNKKNNFISANY